MKRTLVVLTLVALPLFSAFAQDAPKSRMFLIHEEIAKPAMLGQYETVTKELVSSLAEKKADTSAFGVTTYMTTDFHYLYVLPLENWGKMEGIQKSWMALGDVIGKAKAADIMRRGNGSMSSYSEFVALYRPDLSYMPATPRLKQSEGSYVRWSFYYLDPEHAEESEQIARDYSALFKAKNIPDGFNIYQVISGNDLPLLVVSVHGKSAADLAQAEEKNNATLGKDVFPLAARAMGITRRYETKDGMYRPDLSYPNPMAGASK